MLKYTTLFQRWFDDVWRCKVISTYKQLWNKVEMFAGAQLLSPALDVSQKDIRLNPVSKLMDEHSAILVYQEQQIFSQKEIDFQRNVVWQDRRVTRPPSRKTQFLSHSSSNTTLNFSQALQNRYRLLKSFFQKSWVSLKLNALRFV